ncbi:MAG: glutamate--cysteine ligase [Actinomycetota bacterium]|nr:glutamate--cysteine ligase [Actinomycetota bacterium]
MGRDIDRSEFTPEDRVRYRDKVKSNLTVLRRLIDAGELERDRRKIGVELETCLTDGDGNAAAINAALLERIASAEFQTELAQYQIEFDLEPRWFHGDALSGIEGELRQSLERAERQARTLDAHVMIIGILPTLADFNITEQNMSANERYKALNDEILGMRGEDFVIHIEGEETLRITANSILFEAACQALQLHLQVNPDDFAAYWNVAQALSAPLLAAGANSPFLLGKQLHHETRIALFEQSIDTRTEELAQQGVRPRVWFGEKWLSEGVFELFDENVRYFPALLPVCDEEEPHEELAAGRTPHLPELSLHNGTIYRWNRPVYGVADGRPHVRIENRVLPSGPTVVDCVANAALFYGMLKGLFAQQPQVWQDMSFHAATENFFRAARHGLDATMFWPNIGDGVPVSELLLRHLVPLARRGLEECEIDAGDVDRLLDIVCERVVARRNGAGWQIAAHRHLLESESAGADEALHELVRRYQRHSQDGEPVHTWPLDA